MCSDVQMVTVPSRPASAKDWSEEDGGLSRAALHGVRALPTVVMLADSKGRVFDLDGGEGAAAASLPGKSRPCLQEKASARPAPDAWSMTFPRAATLRQEAAAHLPAPWSRCLRKPGTGITPGTMKRLEKLDLHGAGLPGRPRGGPSVWRKTGRRPPCLRESFPARRSFFHPGIAWTRGVPAGG